MVCLGVKPGEAGWKEQMNPLSYGGTSTYVKVILESIRDKGFDSL